MYFSQNRVFICSLRHSVFVVGACVSSNAQGVGDVTVHNSELPVSLIIYAASK